MAVYTCDACLYTFSAENFPERCPDCGKVISIFGESHIDDVSAELGVPVIGRIPVDPDLAACVDAGDFASWVPDYIDQADAVIPVKN